jgi:hypothetical protein
MLAQLKYGRAVWTFCVAHVVVTVLAIALSVGIGMGMNLPPTEEPMQNQAYLISERFLPAMNLVVWGVSAAVYFRGSLKTRNEAIGLGVFWVAIAVVVDYIFFVLIKNPISLSPHDFYVGQFPWIYLIYAAIFLGPLAMVVWSEFGAARPVTR